jgi:hypothetical protein
MHAVALHVNAFELRSPPHAPSFCFILSRRAYILSQPEVRVRRRLSVGDELISHFCVTPFFVFQRGAPALGVTVF